MVTLILAPTYTCAFKIRLKRSFQEDTPHNLPHEEKLLKKRCIAQNIHEVENTAVGV